MLLVVPSGGQQYTQNAAEFMGVFGFGADWKFSPRFGLRMQDRNALYHAPNLNTYSTATGAITYTQEPVLGVYYRF